MRSRFGWATRLAGAWLVIVASACVAPPIEPTLTPAPTVTDQPPTATLTPTRTARPTRAHGSAHARADTHTEPDTGRYSRAPAVDRA